MNALWWIVYYGENEDWKRRWIMVKVIEMVEINMVKDEELWIMEEWRRLVKCGVCYEIKLGFWCFSVKIMFNPPWWEWWSFCNDENVGKVS